MKVNIALATSMLLLTSCTAVPNPTPAPLEGNGSGKAQVMQLSQRVREALGAKNKDELIIRVGTDGTMTLFGAEGLGFKVEAVKEEVPTEKGVVNKVTITTVKNSPVCNNVIFAGNKYWYPVPDCPHL